MIAERKTKPAPWTEDFPEQMSNGQRSTAEPSAHDRLVRAAATWLNKRCALVVTELVAGWEVADAIGWRGPRTMLVECKASRADFVADAQKPFRLHPDSGMGNTRYFLSLPGVIAIPTLPAKWGLLELHGRRVRVIKESEVFDSNRECEASLLLSLIRRIGTTAPHGVSVKCYVHQTRCKATMSVEPTGPPDERNK